MSLFRKEHSLVVTIISYSAYTLFVFDCKSTTFCQHKKTNTNILLLFYILHFCFLLFYHVFLTHCKVSYYFRFTDCKLTKDLTLYFSWVQKFGKSTSLSDGKKYNFSKNSLLGQDAGHDTKQKAQVCGSLAGNTWEYQRERIEISGDASYSLLPPPLFTSSFSMPRSAFFTLALSEPKR